jgi:glycosyltransferase involved in cell wall biosynthesis
MVIFDRFYAEEAYSFHFREYCPHALRVLDMQDMHSLRLGREEVVLRKRDEDVEVQDPFGRLEESIQYEPRAYDEKLLRELASLHRSDLAMVCSPREIVLLEKLGLARQKLVPASFWVEPMGSVQRTTFESRKNFVFLGGFKHPPNVDAVKVLAESIWPKIHQLLPESSLHIYGAFCPPQLAKNFKHIPNLQIHGFASSLEDILTEHRVMLAPLRFGAGIKGKIVDAWNFGLPVVSTGIGMEGMTNCSGLWGGRIANAVDDYVAAAVDLYSNQPEWAQTSRRGIELNLELFPLSQWDHVVKKLKYSIQHRDELRNRDYHGAILWHHTARSTEYFSRWIECKNKNANNTAL